MLKDLYYSGNVILQNTFCANIAGVEWKHLSFKFNSNSHLKQSCTVQTFRTEWVDVFILCPRSGARLLPTSHIKVSRGRVAHAFHIRRHALVLPLVSLLAVLNLQGTWEMTTPNKEEREGGVGG